MNIYTDPLSVALGVRAIQEFFPDYDFDYKPIDSTLDKRAWFDWTGHEHTEESKKLMSDLQKGALNSMYGTTLPDDHPLKLGYNKGLKFSSEHKQKMSQAKLGKTKSSSHKTSMSAAHKTRLAEKVQCPHCNKYLSKYHWATTKYHFNNCKVN